MDFCHALCVTRFMDSQIRQKHNLINPNKLTNEKEEKWIRSTGTRHEHRLHFGFGSMEVKRFKHHLLFCPRAVHILHMVIKASDCYSRCFIVNEANERILWIVEDRIDRLWACRDHS